MMVAGNILPLLGPLFYPGVLIASFLIFKGLVQRTYIYFLAAPYFLVLGIFVWNEVFPYYSGIVLAVLLGELFARILSLFLKEYWDRPAGSLIFPGFLFMFEFLFQNIPFISFIHMISFIAPLYTEGFVLRAVSFFGGRLFLLLAAITLSSAAKLLAGSRSIKTYGVILLSGILLLVFPSFIDLPKTRTDPEDITAACVQGSYDQTASGKTGDPYEQRFRYYMELAEGVKADITVFPEIAVGLYDTKNKADGKYREYVFETAEKTGGSVLLVFTEGNSETKSKQERYISAFFADENGILGITRKRNLVPFSEAAKYSKGTSYEVYDAGKVRAGISICYDISSMTVERLKKNGAEIILAPFNDSGFGKVYHNIHRALPVIKASECSVPIVLASEDGISEIIDRDGRVLAELGFGEKGSISGSIALEDRISVYLNFGVYLEWAVFAVMTVLAAGSFIRQFLGRLKKALTASGEDPADGSEGKA
jgi:apolipoprotein N-acyltransferase